MISIDYILRNTSCAKLIQITSEDDSLNIRIYSAIHDTFNQLYTRDLINKVQLCEKVSL